MKKKNEYTCTSKKQVNKSTGKNSKLECYGNLQQVLAGGVDFAGLYRPSLGVLCRSGELKFKRCKTALPN